MLSQVTERLHTARDLDSLLSALLEALRSALGFEHLMVLMADENEERLFTVASFGYEGAGVGAQVAIGQGLVGIAAERQRTLRLADLDSDLRYGRAIRRSVMIRRLARHVPRYRRQRRRDGHRERDAAFGR